MGALELKSSEGGGGAPSLGEDGLKALLGLNRAFSVNRSGGHRPLLQRPPNSFAAFFSLYLGD